MGLLRDAIAGLTGPVATYFTRRAELSAAKFQATLAAEVAKGERVAKLVSEGLAADASWELESLRAHSHGWKDDAVLVMFMIPYVLCFIPSTVQFVNEGFAALATTPTWYQVASVSIFMAIYGIRWWRRNQSDTE